MVCPDDTGIDIASMPQSYAMGIKFDPNDAARVFLSPLNLWISAHVLRDRSLQFNRKEASPCRLETLESLQKNVPKKTRSDGQT